MRFTPKAVAAAFGAISVLLAVDAAAQASGDKIIVLDVPCFKAELKTHIPVACASDRTMGGPRLNCTQRMERYIDELELGPQTLTTRSVRPRRPPRDGVLPGGYQEEAFRNIIARASPQLFACLKSADVVTMKQYQADKAQIARDLAAAVAAMQEASGSRQP